MESPFREGTLSFLRQSPIEGLDTCCASKADPVFHSRSGPKGRDLSFIRHFGLLKRDAVIDMRQVSVELWGSSVGARRSSGVESVHTSARA